MQFVVFGVRFEVSFLFLSLMTVFIAFDNTGIYLPMLISVLLHEAAHILCLLIFKSKVRAVKLIIGAISVEYIDTLSKNKKIISLLAGPVANFVLALLALWFGFDILFVVNIILGTYNLLIVKGLDGGGILEAALEGVVAKKSIDLVLKIFTAILCSLALLICFSLFSKEINNYSLLLFCIYLISPLLLKNLLKDEKF